MTTTTYSKLSHSHLNISKLETACPTIHRIIKRLGLTVHRCGALRALGFVFDTHTPDDAQMLSLMDVERLGAHWKVLSHASGLDFNPDAYWSLRPSAQFSHSAVLLQRQVEKNNSYLNFIDTLVDPVTNTTHLLCDIDNTRKVSWEGEYHENTMVEVPAISEGVAYFFVDEAFLTGDLYFISYDNERCKRHVLDRMFDVMDELTAHSGMECKLMKLSGWRGTGEELTRESVGDIFDKMAKALSEKETRARKRAQKKYVKEQEAFLNNIPF